MKRNGKWLKVGSPGSGIFAKVRGLFVVLLLLTGSVSAEAGFVTNASFDSGALRVTLLNYEVAKGKPYLIAHFELDNQSNDDQRCDWVSLVTLQCQDGTTMTSNYDVLVDTGTGGARATGPFVVPKRRKARASLLFVLSPGDLPGYLVLPDGRRSARIDFRGKVRWSQ